MDFKYSIENCKIFGSGIWPMDQIEDVQVATRELRMRHRLVALGLYEYINFEGGIDNLIGWLDMV